MSFGLIETVSIAALFSGVVILGIGLWQWQHAGKSVLSKTDVEKELARLIREGEDRISQLLQTLDASQRDQIDGMRLELTSVKSDIEWLTGERMIEQAVSMARDGMSAEDISADLGLSLEAAQTISVIRRH